jgi:phage-related minor tail protein
MDTVRSLFDGETPGKNPETSQRVKDAREKLISYHRRKDAQRKKLADAAKEKERKVAEIKRRVADAREKKELKERLAKVEKIIDAKERKVEKVRKISDSWNPRLSAATRKSTTRKEEIRDAIRKARFRRKVKDGGQPRLAESELWLYDLYLHEFGSNGWDNDLPVSLYYLPAHEKNGENDTDQDIWYMGDDGGSGEEASTPDGALANYKKHLQEFGEEFGHAKWRHLDQGFKAAKAKLLAYAKSLAPVGEEEDGDGGYDWEPGFDSFKKKKILKPVT